MRIGGEDGIAVSSGLGERIILSSYIIKVGHDAVALVHEDCPLFCLWVL